MKQTRPINMLLENTDIIKSRPVESPVDTSILLLSVHEQQLTFYKKKKFQSIMGS